MAHGFENVCEIFFGLAGGIYKEEKWRRKELLTSENA